jgi:mannosyltransferase OCH1-like enzyme
MRRDLILRSERLTMSAKPIEPPIVDEMEHPLSEHSFDWHDFQPEMLQGKSRFSVELTTYRDHLDALLADAGRYVVIKTRDIIGIYDDLDAAVEAAFQSAPEPVFVKQIVEKEPIREVE